MYIDKSITNFEASLFNYNFDPFIDGFAFVFITKPMLYLKNTRISTRQNTTPYINMLKDDYFTKFIRENNNASSSELELFNQLTFDFEGPFDFLPILTNRNRGFEGRDITLELFDLYKTRNGLTGRMPVNINQSITSSEFSMNFSEDANLNVTTLFSLWVRYIQNISTGVFLPNPEMFKKRQIDYMSSIYYIVLKPDMKTIMGYSKYTGVVPLNVPYTALGYTKGVHDAKEISVNFSYSHREDMNPNILLDFNQNTSLRFRQRNTFSNEISMNDLYYNNINLSTSLENKLPKIDDIDNMNSNIFIYLDETETINGKKVYSPCLYIKESQESFDPVTTTIKNTEANNAR